MSLTRIKPRLRFSLIMRAMHRAFSLLRGRHIIGRVMGGFLLSVMLAGVSPWMQPGALDQICSASGNLGLLSPGAKDVGSNPTPGRLHGILDCALCLPMDMPAVTGTPVEPVKQIHALVSGADRGRSAEWLRWATLPARAPPIPA